MFLFRCTDILTYILRKNRKIHHCKKKKIPNGVSGFCTESPEKTKVLLMALASWTHYFVCKALQLLQVRKYIITWHNWSICKLISASISKGQVEEKWKNHNETYVRGKWNKIIIIRRSGEDKRQINKQRERKKHVLETKTHKEKPVQQWNIWA